MDLWLLVLIVGGAYVLSQGAAVPGGAGPQGSSTPGSSTDATPAAASGVSGLLSPRNLVTTGISAARQIPQVRSFISELFGSEPSAPPLTISDVIGGTPAGELVGADLLAAVAPSSLESAAAPALVVSDVIGGTPAGELVGAQITSGVFGPAEAGAEATSAALTATGTVLATVGFALSLGALIFNAYQMGVFSDSDWHDDVPRAQASWARAWAGINAIFGGNLSAARAAWAADPLSGPGQLYDALLDAYFLDVAMATGLNEPLGKETGLPWNAAWLPMLNQDVVTAYNRWRGNAALIGTPAAYTTTPRESS